VLATTLACATVGLGATMGIAWLGAGSLGRDVYPTVYFDSCQHLGDHLTPEELGWLEAAAGEPLGRRLIDGLMRPDRNGIASMEVLKVSDPFDNPGCGMGLAAMIDDFDASHADPRLKGHVVVTRLRSGWPLPALTASTIDLALWWKTLPPGLPVSTGRPALHGVLSGIELAQPTWPGEHLRPTRPLWAGLLVDTLVVGALAWLAWWAACFAVGALRAHRRRSRGLCVRCGYDRRGSGIDPCPECGAA
jgi:hypothetical protein